MVGGWFRLEDGDPAASYWVKQGNFSGAFAAVELREGRETLCFFFGGDGWWMGCPGT